MKYVALRKHFPAMAGVLVMVNWYCKITALLLLCIA